jgi:hypothetical protein
VLRLCGLADPLVGEVFEDDDPVRVQFRKDADRVAAREATLRRREARPVACS